MVELLGAVEILGRCSPQQPVETEPIQLTEPKPSEADALFEGWQKSAEGAGGFAVWMHFVSECVRAWRKAWKEVRRSKRREFAEAVLDYAIHARDKYAVRLLSVWLEQPGVWERLERLVPEERRRELSEAVVDYAVKALNKGDWTVEQMLRRAFEHAAERELGEIARREAASVLGPEKGK